MKFICTIQITLMMKELIISGEKEYKFGSLVLII